ncbi:hypothetical protein GALMADRAFT_278382 [Galerina marginata CBS 339.88]|uniref:Uncharacterized protein n=1 Tax=Galerina marginata (strain CBS 339.88) TaxID=685588 RepID=A0A067T6S1_GALM3|nr:hypothetical protein GALMADRAFT_278382 [Galerina marginata CBS 339.88]
MKSFKKLIALVALTLATSKIASSAPILEQALDLAGQVIDTDPTVQILDENLSDPSTPPLRRFRSIANIWNRSVSKLLKPVLSDLQETTQGVDNGIEAGTGNIDHGLHGVSSGIGSVASGAADITEGTVQGLGNTIASLPKALYGLLLALGNDKGILGKLTSTLT